MDEMMYRRELTLFWMRRKNPGKFPLNTQTGTDEKRFTFFVCFPLCLQKKRHVKREVGGGGGGGGGKPTIL